MKTTFLPIALVALLSGSLAEAQVPSPRPSPRPGDTVQEIDAQLAITRRGVDGLLAKLGQNSAPAAYVLKDYWKLNPVFRKTVENALVRFEETLKKDLLQGLVGPAMDDYNSLFKSDAFDPAQKAMLIKQQRTRISDVMEKFGKRYREAVVRAFRESGIQIYFVRDRKRERDSRDYGHVTKTRRHALRCVDYDCDSATVVGSGFVRTREQYGGTHVRGDDLLEEIHDDFKKRLREGCVSQLCVVLRASDRLAAISLMRALFERAIEMKLVDSTSIVFQSPKLERLDLLMEMLGQPERFDVSDLPLDAK